MKMLGTVLWPVRSASTDWIAEPSSTQKKPLAIEQRLWWRNCLRTDLVQLDSVKLRPSVREQFLRLVAVRAIALGEDGDGVLVDDGLHFGLGGGHCGGRGGAAKEAAEEGGNGCGFKTDCEEGLLEGIVWGQMVGVDLDVRFV
jgi:hypothetical protein